MRINADITLTADELRQVADALDNLGECGGAFLEHHACTALELLNTLDPAGAITRTRGSQCGFEFIGQWYGVSEL